VALYPGLAHPETGYMLVATSDMPHALRGILLAGFMAAFMSTVATQLNWGSSYLVADFYRRFFRKGASEAHYVVASRVATVILVLAAAGVSMLLASVAEGWKFVLEVGAGTGSVYMLRWYWWRINAWSEISAMLTALFVTLCLHDTPWWGAVLHFTGSAPVIFAKTTLMTTGITTLVWIAVTMVTQAEPQEVLLRFYRKVRPHVAGWKPIARLAPEIAPTRDLGRNLLLWILGCGMVYAALFGIGKLCFGDWLSGMLLICLALACGAGIYSGVSRFAAEAPETAG
jgi:Na+/proline symporter